MGGLIGIGKRSIAKRSPQAVTGLVQGGNDNSDNDSVNRNFCLGNNNNNQLKCFSCNCLTSSLCYNQCSKCRNNNNFVNCNSCFCSDGLCSSRCAKCNNNLCQTLGFGKRSIDKRSPQE